MHNYFFKGKIYPDGLKISFDPNLHLKIVQSDFGISGDVIIKYNDSDVDIEFTTYNVYNQSNTGEIETLTNFIEDTVRVAIDAFCYVKSYAFDFYIYDFKDDHGFIYTFSPRGEYNINISDVDAQIKVVDILSKLHSNNKNISLINVLADFRMSIKYPKMTASFCYRSIETIRQNFFNDNWINMRDVLGLDQKDFDQILKFGVPNRHGDYPSISYTQRENIMNFTRDIIEKTLKHI